MNRATEANRCRGLCFLTFRDIVREKYGAPAWLVVVAALDDELRTALQADAVVPNGWYPLRWYGQLHRVARTVLGANGELARDVGRMSTYRDLRAGPLQLISELFSPQTVIGNAHRVFGSYYESGRMVVEEATAGRAQARWSRCREFDHNIWEDVFGGCVGALEAAGARHVKVERLAGGSDDDEQATILVRWD